MSTISDMASVGDVDGVLKCLEDGIQLNIDNVVYQASKNGHVNVVKALVKAKVRVDGVNNAALCVACENGHASVVRALIRGGAYFNSYTAAELAVKNGHVTVVKALIATGADIDFMVKACCSYGQRKLLKLLLKIWAGDRSERDAALSLACKKGHLAIVKELVKPANVDIISGIYDACSCGQSHVVRYLLKMDFKRKSTANLSPLIECALDGGHVKTAIILLNAGIKIDWCAWRNFTGRTDEPRKLSLRAIKQALITSAVKNEMAITTSEGDEE